jgi:hypothetical protein
MVIMFWITELDVLVACPGYRSLSAGMASLIGFSNLAPRVIGGSLSIQPRGRPKVL